MNAKCTEDENQGFGPVINKVIYCLMCKRAL